MNRSNTGQEGRKRTSGATEEARLGMQQSVHTDKVELICSQAMLDNLHHCIFLSAGTDSLLCL